MSRATDDMLQDYLDGRLTAERRAEFERLLEGDAELAGRVEAYLEQGRALREGGPELSAGFYRRARARFEKAHPAKRRGLHRLLSWEAAGLAAAAALVGILFIPGLLHWGGKREPFTETKPAAEKELQSSAPDITEPSPGLADELAPGEQPTKEASPKQETHAAQRTYADAPAAAAPPPPAATRDKKGGRARRLEESEMLPEAMGAADAAAPEQRLRIPLPRDTIAPGGMIVIENEEQWRSIAELSTLPYDPRFRWLLIGAGPQSLDCAGIAVVTTADSHRILLRPGADWSCALALPRDGRTIELIPAASDDHE